MEIWVFGGRQTCLRENTKYFVCIFVDEPGNYRGNWWKGLERLKEIVFKYSTIHQNIDQLLSLCTKVAGCKFV